MNEQNGVVARTVADFALMRAVTLSIIRHVDQDTYKKILADLRSFSAKDFDTFDAVFDIRASDDVKPSEILAEILNEYIRDLDALRGDT